jgi:integrase
MPFCGVRNMTKLPFSLFKRAGRRFFYVSFKNGETGEYLPAISTKQETESGAAETAFQWLKDGIPRRGEAVPLKKYSLRDMARGADMGPADCEYICKELRRRGLLASYVLTKSREAVPLTDFLLNFWDYDHSPYIKEKQRKGQGLSKNYTVGQARAVESYIVPFFTGRLLGEVTRGEVEGFVDRMADKKLSAGRKNKIIHALTVPLKWAFHREMIARDPTEGIIWFSGKSRERQILSPDQAAAVFRVQWKDDRTRLANMAAMVTGMRAGEIQGLRVQDLGRDCLYVRHSWNCRDRLKTTKNRESRTVELPFPGLLRELADLAARNPHGATMDSYVFWAEVSPDKPMEACLFIRDLRGALIETGMSKESAAVYTFHGWRHYFTAYMRERITEKLLKSQTGHKTTVMLDLYSGHAIAGDRERIREAQRAVFGGLLPDSGAGYLVTAEGA